MNLRSAYQWVTLKAPRLFLAVCAAGASTVTAFSQGLTHSETDSLWADVVSYLVIGTIAWVGLEIRNLQKERVARAERRAERDMELEKRLLEIEHRLDSVSKND